MRAAQNMCFRCGRVYCIDEMAPGSAQSGAKESVAIWLCGACQLSMTRGRSVVVVVEGKRVRVKLDGKPVARVPEMGEGG